MVESHYYSKLLIELGKVSVMKSWLAVILAAIISPVWAVSTSIHPEVEKMIMQISPPDGVVIEVESLSEDAMTEYFSNIQTQVTTLRQRYPNLDIVIVSHGRELVTFVKPEPGEVMSDVAQAFQTMKTTQDVTIYICEVAASWLGYFPEDFMDFIDVAPSGPAQINDYKALGYTMVVIEDLTDEQRQTIMPEEEEAE